MRLLVTRPEPDAARTAEILRARSHAVLVAPLLVMQTVEAQFTGSYDGVLLTSANAARALASHPRGGELTGLPCLTVGNRTAEAAHAAGFTRIESAGGSLADLVQLAAAKFDRSARLLYLAGEDRAGDLARDLARFGVSVDTVVIYRAEAATRLPPELARALNENGLDGALHYSQRSAATLLTLAKSTGALGTLLGLAHYCLSEDVAAPLREAGANRVAIAARPHEASLLALIEE